MIRAANSQPYSHIHQPGLGVGGHCIPVYPHFLLSRAPEMELVEARRGGSTTGRWRTPCERWRDELGGLRDVPVLVLGLTYREGVKELAYSRAIPLIEQAGGPRAPTSRRGTRCCRPTDIEALGGVALDVGVDRATRARSSPRRRMRRSAASTRRGSRPSR